jgi:2-iminoacetate synthase ThiH
MERAAAEIVNIVTENGNGPSKKDTDYPAFH